MLETKTVSINGHRYRIQQLGAYQARAVARLLMNEIGRGLKAASGVDLEDQAQKAIAAGVGELLANLSDETMESLTTTFLGSTMVDTGGGFRPLDDELQNALFGGGKGLSAWLTWLTECVEFSVADFFRGLVGLKDRFGKKAEAEAGEPSAEPAPSPITSTGSSTKSRPPISIGRR